MATKTGEKTGGRRKGTPNKDSVPLAERAAALGIDPFEILLHFAAGNYKELGYAEERIVVGINEWGTWEKYTIDHAVRQKAAAEACSYLFPKKKAIEHSSPDGTNPFQSFAEMVAGLLKEGDAKEKDSSKL